MVNPMMVLFAAEEAQKEGIAVLGIDPKAIILQAGTFVLLFLILKKFALRGIVDTLEKRRTTIDKGVALGIEMQSAKEGFDKELTAMQAKARQQADKILAQAHTEAGDIIKAGEASAAKKVDSMLADAKVRIDREMQSAKRDLQAEMLSLVSEATEVIISEKLDAKKDASLIARALSKVRA